MSHTGLKLASIRLGHSPELAVRAHGWPLLAPFVLRPNALEWAVDLPDAAEVRMSWPRGGSSVSVHVNEDAGLSSGDHLFLCNRVKWTFRADEDLSEFWQLCQGDPVLSLCVQSRAGILLRSATIFEDVVKTLCTTNCHWRNTKRMGAKLCSALGCERTLSPYRQVSAGPARSSPAGNLALRPYLWCVSIEQRRILRC